LILNLFLEKSLNILQKFEIFIIPALGGLRPGRRPGRKGSSILKIARILKPCRDSDVLVKLTIKDPSASVNPVTNKGFKVEAEICV